MPFIFTDRNFFYHTSICMKILDFKYALVIKILYGFKSVYSGIS